jgi:hypothetical protein
VHIQNLIDLESQFIIPEGLAVPSPEAVAPLFLQHFIWPFVKGTH